MGICKYIPNACKFLKAFPLKEKGRFALQATKYLGILAVSLQPIIIIIIIFLTTFHWRTLNCSWWELNDQPFAKCMQYQRRATFLLPLACYY